MDARCVLTRRDTSHLVAGGTARLQRFGVMAATIEPAICIEIDEVHEQLGAGRARKAAGMPRFIGARSSGAY